MTRKYKVDSKSQPIIAQAGNCIIRLIPPCTDEEGDQLYKHVRRNNLTCWLSFNVVTNELLRNSTPGKEMVAYMWDNEYCDNLLFVLIGNVYRLIGKNYSEKSVLPGVVSIDISESVCDNHMKQALMMFAKTNPDFICEYTGHSY